ncbi:MULTISPECIES: DUF5805 domain-containing protein [Saliphagus]|uniref:DUF5805 domain-containing protein n=1 Tax=Saliphagus infecundisoli TaxID=1849069 RepID=A0ABD5QC07_9EURY|nr:MULTISPECIES: DUF5805 domain-containing protein [Saliphagus]
MSDSAEESRVAVKTRVPAYQKQQWVEHAEELDMSQSEFVRTMVQAGRKGFEPDHEEPRSGSPDPRGNGLETRVLELLSEGPRSWEELLEAASGEIEERLDETLEDLQSRGRVRYSGRHGGYTVIGGESDGE